MEPVKIKIDHGKLIRALEDKKMSCSELSRELGFADQYINTRHKRGDMYPIAIVKLKINQHRTKPSDNNVRRGNDRKRWKDFFATSYQSTRLSLCGGGRK